MDGAEVGYYPLSGVEFNGAAIPMLIIIVMVIVFQRGVPAEISNGLTL